MAVIGTITRQKIKAYLEVFIEKLIEEYRNSKILQSSDLASYLAQTSPKGKRKPFHAALIPPELLRINQFERAFSTRLGNTYEECARLIALEHHAEVQRSYDITSLISSAAIEEINRQVAIFDHMATKSGPKPTLTKMVEAVLEARQVSDLENHTTRADLYIRSHNGIEYFFEIKSPMPNKGQCLEVTQRILRFHLLRGQAQPKIQAYFAMAYNPYGPERSDYKWTYAKNYIPFEQAVVIGPEFWNIVGGEHTYEELLEIYQEVGHDKTKHIIDALAFGF